MEPFRGCASMTLRHSLKSPSCRVSQPGLDYAFDPTSFPCFSCAIPSSPVVELQPQPTAYSLWLSSSERSVSRGALLATSCMRPTALYKAPATETARVETTWAGGREY